MMKKLVFRNVECCLGSFTPKGDIELDGSIHYSSKDFSSLSGEELNSLFDKYEGQFHLEAKAFRLEVAERKLANWRRNQR
jgi:hypothetical protein